MAIYESEHLKVFVKDEPGAGGACHEYEIVNKETGEILETASFQNGNIDANGVNGSTNEAYLAIVRHRLACFMAGPFPHAQTAKALCHTQDAIDHLEARTADRKERGVEGKDIP